MWVFEEKVDGHKLTKIINTQHENVKYLPGIRLPPNVVAFPDLQSCVENVDILLFVIPHQFLVKTCQTIKPFIKKDCYGCSLIKVILKFSLLNLFYHSLFSLKNYHEHIFFPLLVGTFSPVFKQPS